MDKKVTNKRIKQHTQYADYGNVQRLSPDTIKELEAGVYKLDVDMNGPLYIKHDIQTDALLRFEDERYKMILEEIDRFWNMEEEFETLGFTHKRGMLLFGEPGTGKTCLLKLVIDDVVKRDNIVFLCNNASTLIIALKAFREVEEKRKALIVLEDMDEIVRYGEHNVLQLFDGENQVDGILYLATTNYIDRLPPRVLRPGRFDRKIEIKNPPIEGRLVYLKDKLSNKLKEDEIQELAEKTRDFSFGQLREFVIAAFIYKYPIDKTINRLKNGMQLESKSIEDITKVLVKEDSLGFELKDLME